MVKTFFPYKNNGEGVFIHIPHSQNKGGNMMNDEVKGKRIDVEVIKLLKMKPEFDKVAGTEDIVNIVEEYNGATIK